MHRVQVMVAFDQQNNLVLSSGDEKVFMDEDHPGWVEFLQVYNLQLLPRAPYRCTDMNDLRRGYVLHGESALLLNSDTWLRWMFPELPKCL